MLKMETEVAESVRPAVLIFRTRLLPYSETFIATQGRGLDRYRPVFTGFHLVEGGPEYLGDADRVLLEDSGVFPSLAKGLFKLTGRVPPGWLAEMKRRSPVLVHAHFGHNGAQAIPIAEALGIPLIVTYQGADITVAPSEKSHAERKLVFSHATRVLGVSQFMVDRLVEAGCPAEKAQVAYTGVNTDRFRPANGGLQRDGVPEGALAKVDAFRHGRVVLFVGRLVEKKGLHHAIRAMVAVRERVPDAQLMVVGDGPLRGEWESLAEQLGAPVTFLGLQPPAVVSALMQAASVFVSPSVVAENGDQEGLPNTIFESIASGLPVVAFPSGGSAEAIDEGVSGFVLSFGDVEGLALRLGDILSDDDLRTRLSAGAREQAVRRFSLPVVTAHLEAIYDQVRGQP